MGSTRPELLLIRHAPIAEAGVLAGRSDLAARIDPGAAAALRASLPEVASVITSPALRCRQTAEALWPDVQTEADPRLWEQDFGARDGTRLADLPDLGPLTPEALAAHRWPGGESFAALCSRARPGILAAAAQADWQLGPVAVVAHAGVVRAALALALGSVPGALSFVIDPLSVTRISVFEGRPSAISLVNGGPQWQ